MIYGGTIARESIVVNVDGETHFIDMAKSLVANEFYVSCCCDDDWLWKFESDDSADYERAKFCIMEQIFDSDTMVEALDALSEIFENGFEAELVQDRRTNKNYN